MIEGLQAAVDAVGELHSKLVLLVSHDHRRCSRALRCFASQRGSAIVSVGSALGRRLASRAASRRPITAVDTLRDLLPTRTDDNLVMLDHLEILFDRTLRIDPLDVLRQIARVRKVLAVWPGEMNDQKLQYATHGHAEFREYGVEGVVTFEIQS